MVKVKDQIKSSLSYFNYSRIKAAELVEVINNQAPLSRNVVIHSGDFSFDSAGDLLRHWDLVGNELDIRFQFGEIYSPSICLNINKRRVCLSIEEHHNYPNSSIVAANATAFVRRSYSLLKNVIFLSFILLGFSLLAFSVIPPGEFVVSLVLPKIISFILGSLLVSNAGRITSIVLPTLRRNDSLLEGSNFLIYLLFPTLVILIGHFLTKVIDSILLNLK